MVNWKQWNEIRAKKRIKGRENSEKRPKKGSLISNSKYTSKKYTQLASISKQRGRDSPLQLRVSQWNGRSVQSLEKIDFAKNLPGLVSLQEIWHQDDNVRDINRCVDMVTRECKRGGGTALINNCPDLYTISILKRHKINKDSNLLKMRINGNYLWLGNIYINPPVSARKIQKIFGKLR